MWSLGIDSLAVGADVEASPLPPPDGLSEGDNTADAGAPNNDDGVVSVFVCVTCSSFNLTVCLRGRFPPEAEVDDGSNDDDDDMPRLPGERVAASRTERLETICLILLPRRKLSLFPVILFFFFIPEPASRDTISLRAARCALRRARLSSRRRFSTCWRSSSACSHFS